MDRRHGATRGGGVIALLLLAAQAAAAPAPAPTPAIAATAPIPPDRMAAAVELVRVSKVEEAMRSSIVRTLEAMRSGAQLSAQLDQNPAVRMERARNPQAWDAAIKRIGAKQADAFQSVFTDMAPLIRQRAVDTYASNFTTAELRDLTAFYQTPLGRKVVDRLPVVMGETTSWMQQELPRRLGPAIAALQPEIQREIAPLLPQPKK